MTTVPSTGGTTSAQPPRAEDDRVTLDEGGSTNIAVASNDLVATNPLALGSLTVVDPPANGTVTALANGTLDYTHDGGETTSDSLTYLIEDNAGLSSNVANVLITVNPINDLPVAVDDADLVDQGAVVVLDLLGNDTDVDDGLNPGSLVIVDPPAFATLIDNGDGTVDYDHDGTGVPYDSFTYTISDFSGAVSNIALVELVVNTTNVPPFAVDDSVIVAEGGQANVSLFYNDVDPDDGVDPASISIVGSPANGSVVVLLDGSVDYTHDGSETNSDSFSYRVADLSGAPSNTAVVQVLVSPVNDPPLAVDDLVNVDEGMTANAPVLVNDIDVDGFVNSLTVVIGTQPTNGTAIVNGNGTIDYTHNGSQTVLDSFSYFVNDNGGLTSNEGTVNVQVNLINDPPLAGDDAGLVDEGSSVVLDLAGNDSDTDDAIDLGSIFVVSSPANGTLQINGDGTVQYDHDGSETTSDSFAYTIDDMGGGTSNVAMVSVAVTPVNDAPVAVNDAFVVAEGGLNNLQNILSNDSDADDGLNAASVVIDTPPLNGILIVNLNGTTSYSHDGSNTVADSYTYHVLDNSGAPSNVATVNITVSGINDPPVATNDTLLLPEGGSANVDVLANDTDSDNGIDTTTTQIVTAPAHGSTVVLPDGSVDYTHNGDEAPNDSFTYVFRDLGGLTSNEATVTVVVNPVNDPPTAVNDAIGVGEGSLVNVNVLSNDTDPDSAIDLTTVTILTAPVNGSAVALPDGTVDYTHDGSDTIGDSFTYTVDDVNGATSNIASVLIAVSAVNDPPVAVNDSGVVDEGAGVNVAVLANDSDPDDGLNPASVIVVSAPANGSTAVLGDGSITYTHNGSETVSDSFTYRVSDFFGTPSNTATVSLTINPVNDPPTANDDSIDADEGALTNMAVLANDVDPEGALNTASVVIVTPPTHGTATPLPNGTVDYQHDGTEAAPDSFTYRVSDVPGLASNTATVSIAVQPVNDPPVAVNDAGNVDEGAFADILVLANDTDPDDGVDTNTVVVVSGPTNGTAVVQAGGAIRYTHNGSETASDSFTYRVNDFSGAGSNTATVNLTINPVNDAPVAVNDSANVNEGAGIAVSVLANDTDADDGVDSATVVVVSSPANGSAVVGAGGAITYTHSGSETVSDSFTYRVSDLTGVQSNVATVNLTINPVNDAPVAVNDSGNCSEGGLVDLTVLANDTDADDGLNTGSVVVMGAPINGTAVVQAGGVIRYTHNGSQTVSDSFTYRVQDLSGANSNTATVNLTINAVNNAPVAVNDSANVNEGAGIAVSVLANDTDADDGIDSATVVVVSSPANGSAIVGAGGAITYTHNGSETVSDSFTYRVSDFAGAQSNIATVSMTINPVNDPPVAVNDSGNCNEGGLVDLTILANDTDADDGLNTGSVVVMGAPINGTAVVQPGGTIRYTHNGSQTLSDSFTYRVQDLSGANSNTATVNLTINPVNNPPVAGNDSANVNEGAGVGVNVLANDSDADDGINSATVVVVSGPTNGTAVVAIGGTITYTHNGTETLSDSFTYRVSDNSGAQSNIATVSITINPVNDPPVANNDSANLNEGSGVGVAVLSNDTDPDDGINGATLVVVSAPANGSTAIGPGNAIVYTHNGSETVSDSFTYRVSDFAGAQSNIATVSVTINPVNDPPTLINLGAAVDEGSVGNALGVLAGGTDPDDGIDPNTLTITTFPVNGSAYTSGGFIYYDHNGSETASDSISYRVYDYAGAPSNIANIALTINPVNDPPVALDDFGTSVADGGSVNIPVAANDYDADDGINPYSIYIWNFPSYGYAISGPGGTIDYYSYGGFPGYVDYFSYVISDYAGAQSNIATVEVQIQGAPCSPESPAFGFTGGQQVWTVPAGCDGYLYIDAYGAQGSGGNGGMGGYAGGQFPVRGGDTFYIYVGGTLGYNGGGLGVGNYNPPAYGGGASDVRFNSTSTSNRIVVAGGGGGSGGDSNYRGGDGGGGFCDMNQKWCAGAGAEGYGGPGGGGDYYGGSGFSGPHAGGAGGGGLLGGGQPSCQSYNAPASCGTAGSWAQGGNYDAGAAAQHQLCIDLGVAGGGGGLYGGGGASTGYCGSGGGGGGSSWAGHMAYGYTFPAGWSGDGQVYLYFQPLTPGGGSLVGSYPVNSGPSFGSNPPVYTCQEACAAVFGGGAAQYSCSTSGTYIDNMAWGTSYAIGGCEAMEQGFEWPPGGTYNCGQWGCSISAYTQDNCFETNYCWQ